MSTVGRPTRVLVALAGDHRPRTGSVGPTHVDVEARSGAGHERDPVSLRRPRGRIGVVHLIGQAAYVTTFPIHHVNLGVAAPIRGEGDLLAGRRPARRGVDGASVDEAPRWAGAVSQTADRWVRTVAPGAPHLPPVGPQAGGGVDPASAQDAI